MHHSAEGPNRPFRPKPHISWRIPLTLSMVPLTMAVWLLAVSVDPLPIDVWWHDHVVANPGSAAFFVAYVLHRVGSTAVMTVIGVMLTVVLLIRRRWRQAAAIATTMLGVVVVTTGLKLLVARPRPDDMLVHQLETSFPSGHSLGFAALMTILICVFIVHRRGVWRLTAIGLASILVLAMMWSRTALHVHWLSDTVCGALLGVAIALWVAPFTLRLPHQELLITRGAPTVILYAERHDETTENGA